MQKKIAKTLIVVLIVLMLILSGCGKGKTGADSMTSGDDKKTGGFFDNIFKGGKKGVDSPISINTNFHKGTNGLVISFIDNMPATKPWVYETFYLGIEIKNQGATNIPLAHVKLSNSQPSFMEILQTVQELPNFKGKSMGNPEGDFNMLNFAIINKGIPKTDKSKQFNFIANACFAYETKASTDICITTISAQDIQGVPACKQEKEISLSGGQGGPVAVTKVLNRVDSKDGGHDLHITVYYKNVGLGKLVKRDEYLKACDSGKDSKGLLGANYSIVLSGQELTACIPPKLDPKDKNGDTAFIHCKIEDIEPTTGYVTPLVIEFEYGYGTKQIEKKITIEREAIGGGFDICDDGYCIEDCSIYGGVDNTKSCSEPLKVCCKRPNTLPSCVHLYKEPEHECTEETCGEAGKGTSPCPEGLYCCPKAQITE